VATDLVRNALSISTESINMFHGYAQATNIFHGYSLDYIKSSAGKNDSFARQSSFKAVAVEMTDS
jgi:hypothetical protein